MAHFHRLAAKRRGRHFRRRFGGRSDFGLGLRVCRCRKIGVLVSAERRVDRVVCLARLRWIRRRAGRVLELDGINVGLGACGAAHDPTIIGEDVAHALEQDRGNKVKRYDRSIRLHDDRVALARHHLARLLLTERALDFDSAIAPLALFLHGAACLLLSVGALHDSRRQVLFTLGCDPACNILDGRLCRAHGAIDEATGEALQ